VKARRVAEALDLQDSLVAAFDFGLAQKAEKVCKILDDKKLDNMTIHGNVKTTTG
jgi:hypothetical protein